MKLWNTIFLVLIVILGVFTWFYAGKALTIRREWSTSVTKLQKQIAANRTKLQSEIDGIDPSKPRDVFREFKEMRVGELRNRLDVMISDRVNIWVGCKPGVLNVDNEKIMPAQLGDGNPTTPEAKLQPIHLVQVTVTIKNPAEQDNPDQVITPDKLMGVVYLIDDGQNGKGSGAYLGRFTVVGTPQRIGENFLITLQSATQFSKAEVDLIKERMQSTWTIYSAMPRDRFDEIFNRLTQEDFERIVPREMRDAIKKPDRNLVDFDVVLTSGYSDKVKLDNRISLLKKNNEELSNAIKQMKKEIADVNNSIAIEQKRIALMKDQTTAVQRVLDGYEAVIKKMQESIDKTKKQNEWFAAKIAEYQLKSVQAIEQQAEAAANNVK
ncbi:MAG: hypothetical protein LBQ66_15105 [Planctomycetaceae bacterium]|jgi:prefoldin subunit 5|nr:hypothetical protein [Planctomycetaceae bacterium]